MSNTAVVVAVDGGQSSTLALVATPDGRILGTGLAGPSNHIHEPGGMERLHNALHQSITAALHNAGRTINNVTHVCLGMTGAADIAQQIVQQKIPTAAVQSYYDMVTALAGASVAQPGVVVIAGTGSVAYGRLADGRDARAGGWGWLIGDEGSAFDIGRAALQVAAHAADIRGGPTVLLQRLVDHFQMPSFWDLRNALYTPAITRAQIAGLAALVTAAAQDGDMVALGLLDQAGRDLASIAVGVIKQLGMLDTGMTVYTTGGVFKAGAFVLKPFCDTIQAQSSASAVREAAFSPIIGGLLLALKASGSPLDDSIIGAIRNSLPASAISKHQAKES
ncbi:MAG: hypothetical protein IT324_08035 [Anaerolineae bacterium]|nr:hypothetical protein [Anaerolineae bacterium]